MTKRTKQPTYKIVRHAAMNIYRWRIVAANGQELADSSYGYDTPAEAKRALNRFLRTIAKFGITEEPNERS